MLATIGELVYIKAVLEQLFGSRVPNIPTLAVTDSKNLEEAIKSTKVWWKTLGWFLI
jgi:hypothetical protein